MLAGMMTTQPPVNFAQAIKQLFILTGIEPKQTQGRVSALSRAEHLRFTFTEQGKDFYRVKALLKFLDISHHADLFKKVGHNAENQGVLEYYITVAKQHFIELQHYFLPGAMLKLGDLKDKQFKIHDLNGPLKSALTEILYDPHYLESVKRRNNDSYNLDGVMYYFAKLTMNSMPCFQHLESTGVVAAFNIELEVSSQEKSQPVSDELDASAPITMAYHLHRKRYRPETASNPVPSISTKRPPTGK